MNDTDTGAAPGRDADEAAIVRLTHAYCWALDTGEWDALDDVFTRDATAHLGGDQRGIDEIKQRVSTALGPLDDSQHIVATHQIAIDGDRATSRCYLHAQHVRRDAVGGPHYVVAGRYEDELVRTDRGWRISDRRLVVMWTDGNLAVVRGDV